jgi:hypothetical protein
MQIRHPQGQQAWIVLTGGSQCPKPSCRMPTEAAEAGNGSVCQFHVFYAWARMFRQLLQQVPLKEREYVIAYASRSNNRTERNYSSYAGECLAAVWGVSHFRVYLYGRRFVLLTDHAPLKWLMTNEKLTGMHARWPHILSEYDFEIKHRPGKRSGDADGLSRNPLQDETDLTDARMDHEASSGLPVSVSAGLALLAYQGADISKKEENQTSFKEDFALAVPKGDAPFFWYREGR